MSEHEPWKKNLDDAFKELKEADDNRDARLHHNQQLLQRITEHVFTPVLAQFAKDAEKHGFQPKIEPLNGNRQVVSMKGESTLHITFILEATPDAIKLTAQRQGGSGVNLLQGKPAEQFHATDLADYLATQLREIKPKK
jgi:hypothetical protein